MTHTSLGEAPANSVLLEVKGAVRPRVHRAELMSQWCTRSVLVLCKQALCKAGRANTWTHLGVGETKIRRPKVDLLWLRLQGKPCLRLVEEANLQAGLGATRPSPGLPFLFLSSCEKDWQGQLSQEPSTLAAFMLGA